MNIIQHNSTIGIPIDHVDFARRLAREYDEAHPSLSFYPKNISDLMNEIPVFLVNEATQVENSDGDSLGFYVHKGNILGHKRPAIGLCLERIQKCASLTEQEATPEEIRLLTATVIIHEFAHALMWLTDGASYVNINDGLFKYVEEPLANMITLQYFKPLAQQVPRNPEERHCPYEYVRTFMSTRQPEEYKLGVLLYDYGIHDWCLWRNNKAIIEAARDHKAADGWKETVMGRYDQLRQTLPDDATKIRDAWESLMNLGQGKQVSVSTEVLSAVQSGKEDILKKLLCAEDGSQMNAADCNGWTPLMHAVNSCQPNLVEMIIGLKGCTVDQTDNDKWPALYHAINRGCWESIVHLLSKTDQSFYEKAFTLAFNIAKAGAAAAPLQQRLKHINPCRNEDRMSFCCHNENDDALKAVARKAMCEIVNSVRDWNSFEERFMQASEFLKFIGDDKQLSDCSRKRLNLMKRSKKMFGM